MDMKIFNKDKPELKVVIDNSGFYSVKIYRKGFLGLYEKVYQGMMDYRADDYVKEYLKSIEPVEKAPVLTCYYDMNGNKSLM